MQRRLPVLPRCLSEHGLTLDYGILLGTRRIGKIMDDVEGLDIKVTLDADTDQSSEQIRAEILADLRLCGSTTWESNKHESYQLGHPQHQRYIGLFCARWDRDIVSIHISRMIRREIPPHHIDSTRELQFGDRSYPAPQDVYEFLPELYRSEWKTPNRYHDWHSPMSNGL